MGLGAAGMLLLAQIGVSTAYVTGILPGLVAIGIGLGLVFSTAMNSATLGVQAADAGVASATVNACQQVGGSLGTALLSTLAASAATSFAAGAHARPTPALIASAAVHGYTTAFAVSAAIFAAGAIVAGLLYERGAVTARQAEPVLAH
jgi:hypothetical protein